MEKKIRANNLVPKKKSCNAKAVEKNIVHARKAPPPHHFSNGPPLIDS
jgi:hypothetical protein